MSRRRKIVLGVLAGTGLLSVSIFLFCRLGWKPLTADATAQEVIAGHGGNLGRDGSMLGQPIVSIRFSGGQLTDEGLRELAPYLAQLPSLRELDLRDSGVTDAGLNVLTGLRLKTFVLPYRARTDLGLKYYLALVEPDSTLNLYRWSITDAGLKLVVGQKQLESLSLASSKVTDAGLKELAGMKLHQLIVPDEAKTDLGLKHYLAAVTPKSQLILAGWHITDASMPELATQGQLAYLALSGTNISQAGIQALRKALPNCLVKD